MTATTTIKAIYLGNFAATDVHEGDYTSENTGFLVGTVRDYTQAKMVTITSSDKDHDGVMEDDECNPCGDYITYNTGGGVVSNKTDGSFEANVNLTLADGSVRIVKVVAFQQQNGDLFISDLYNHGTLDNLAIAKLEIVQITGTNYSGWFTNQSADNTTIMAPLVTGDGYVEGNNSDNLIDVAYTGDPEGDRVDGNDAILPGQTGNQDIILAFDGNDTVRAGDAADQIYAGGGKDFVEGGAGNDTIFGDRDLAGSTSTGSTTVRESFEWDRLSDPSGDGTRIDHGDAFTHAAQDTGNVNVTFAKAAFAKSPATTFATNDQKVHSITDDGAAVNPNSSLSSELDQHGEGATYRWTFDTPVTNVSFRINDIDYASEVTIKAYDTNGNPVPITTATGVGISAYNRDGIAGLELLESRSGNPHTNPADTDPNYSALVNIAGPISRLEITHNQDNDLSSGNAGINVTDIYFDAVAGGPVGGGAAHDDTLLGGAGDDLIYGDGGNDELIGDDGDDTLEGGDGDDTLRGGLGADVIDGGAGNDSVRANEGDDTVLGGAGNDTLRGGEDDDTVDGGTDDDLLFGGLGDDSVLGGDGNDELRGNEGADTLDGGLGDDLIVSDDPGDLIDYVTFVGVPVDADPNNNRDLVSGGDGNDTIQTGDDADTVHGDAGDDSIDSGIDDDRVFGGDGNDAIDASLGSDYVDGGAGDDTIIAGFDAFSDYTGDDPNLPNPLWLDPVTGLPAVTDPNRDDGRDTVFGGDGNDVIETGDDADVIFGEADNDTINAGIDDDRVDGGTGDDSIIGGHGSDTIFGGAGDDFIDAGDPSLRFPPLDDASDPTPDNDRDLVEGGSGDDTILGGDDADTLLGGAGDDVLDGGIDDDVIDGGAGDDSLRGGDGRDTVLGGLGDDTLDGGDGADVLDGGDGDDVVIGETGNDTILGGAGDDTIDGGPGEDLVLGGAGDDRITGGPDNDSIFGGDGNDTITGGAGTDYLEGVDDRDLFIGGTDGDTIDGGAGGDDFDVLDLRGAAPDGGSLLVTITGPDLNGNGSDGFVTYRDADGNVTGSFQFSEIEEIIPCFTPGTLIATPKGERLVEELKVGDKVITRDNGLQEIRWIGAKPLTGRDFVKNPRMKPVLIKAGALGNGLPERDTLYSPNHRVLINNEKTALYFDEREVLVAAKHLVGAPGVHEVDVMGTTYIHFMFDHHEVVLSNGSWTESFQPGDMALKGVGDAQRDEIFDLFPDLRTRGGVQDYQSARRSLKKHEARLLLK